jgi:tetratricopeptide (TPR) repeat protein
MAQQPIARQRINRRAMFLTGLAGTALSVADLMFPRLSVAAAPVNATDSRSGDKRRSAWALTSLGLTAICQGDYRRAAALLKESLALSRDLGDKRDMAAGMEELASVACAQEQTERAARLFGAGQALREALGAPLPPADQAPYDRGVAVARARLGENAFAAAWAQGRAMALEQAVAYALEVVPTAPADEGRGHCAGLSAGVRGSEPAATLA